MEEKKLSDFDLGIEGSEGTADEAVSTPTVVDTKTEVKKAVDVKYEAAKAKLEEKKRLQEEAKNSSIDLEKVRAEAKAEAKAEFDAEQALINKKESADPVARAAKANAESVATTAMAVALEANSKVAILKAEREYVQAKRAHMLGRCKSERPVKFVGSKIYQPIFGSPYTFLYNGVPVTVKFDGSEQEFPEFVYIHLMNKINEVSNSNTPVDITENLS